MLDSNHLPESMKGPWNVKDKWFVSPYNFAEEVRAQYKNIPEEVEIRDVTLAEGQHQPGVRYSLEGMIKIAHALYDSGVKMIKQHVGDYLTFEFITAIKRELPDLFIHVTLPIFEYDKYQDSLELCKEEMDRYIAAGANEFDFPGFNSWNIADHVARKFTKEERLARSAEMIRYGISKGVLMEIGFVDVTRSSWEDLMEYWKIAVDAGATSIAVYDSYGTATPDGMRYLVEKTLDEFHLPVMSHVHNDLGSAVATQVGGILGGATICDCSINGLGDRAGNASLEQIVLQLEMNYGIKTGVKMENLLWLCRLVEEITGIEFPYIKPISGKNVFSHESESHAAMVLSQGVDLKYASKHEAYAPSVVGGKRQIMFGRTSLTGTMIHMRMEQLGLQFSDNEVEELRKRIREGDEDLLLSDFDRIAQEVCEENCKTKGKQSTSC